MPVSLSMDLVKGTRYSAGPVFKNIKEFKLLKHAHACALDPLTKQYKLPFR